MHRARAGRVGTWQVTSVTIAVAVAATIIALLANCGEGAEPGPDPSETEPAAADPQRIISLIPQVSDIIRGLGEGRRLVGRIASEDDPALLDLPTVGDPLEPSVERIVQLRPDLLVLWDESRANERLIRLMPDARVWRTRSERLADLWSNLALAGQLLGRREHADSLTAGLRDALSRVARPVSDHAPRAALVVWADPPIAAGPGTYLDDLLTLTGGVNVLADAAAPWPTVAIETLAARDPDVVFWLPQTDAVPPLSRYGGWRTVPAVARGDVVALPRDLFSAPGLEIVRAANVLYSALHHPLNEESS